MKSFILIAISLLAISLLIPLLVKAQSGVVNPPEIIDPRDSEQTNAGYKISYRQDMREACLSGVCTTEIYPWNSPKYFYKNGSWVITNSSFFQCTRGLNNRFCSRDYFFQFIATNTGEMQSVYGIRQPTTRKNSTIKVKPLPFAPFTWNNFEVDNNTIRYHIVNGWIDAVLTKYVGYYKLDYHFLRNLPVLYDFNITYEKSGQIGSSTPFANLCDRNDVCTDLKIFENRTHMSTEVNVSWINDPNHEFPIILDPIVSLNNSNISYDGSIDKNPNSFPCCAHARYNSQINVKAGTQRTTSGPLNIYHNWRSAVEINITNVFPSNLDKIQEANVSIYVNQVGSVTLLNFSNSSKPNTDFADPGQNTAFYKNMADGELFRQVSITTTGRHEFNLTPGYRAHIERQVEKGADWYGLGLSSRERDSGGAWVEYRIASIDHATVNRRMWFVYVYNTSVDSCTPQHNQNWNIVDYCNITTDQDVCPFGIIINESGQMSIADDVDINASFYQIADPPVSDNIRLQMKDDGSTINVKC